MKSRIILFVIFLLLQSCLSTNWDGGFQASEFIYKFEDKNGNPIEGIVLEVRNSSGQLAFNYPVNEFVKEGALTSDTEGSLQFSHQRKRALEFGGTCNSIGIAEWGTCSSPEYTLIFKLKEKEIYSIKYNFLSNLGKQVTIKRVVY